MKYIKRQYKPHILIAILIVLIIFIVSYFIIINNLRPSYIYLTDIEPDYLISSLFILNGERPVSIHHPGTWIHYISAIILYIFNLDPIEDTETALYTLRLAATFFNTLCIFSAVLIGLKNFQLYSLIIFITLSFLFPTTIFYLNYFGADSIIFGLAILLTVYFIRCLQDNFMKRRDILIFAILAGLCLNTKLVFVPLWCIILGRIFISDMLKYKSFLQYRSLTVLITSTTSFFLLGLPVSNLYPISILKKIESENILFIISMLMFVVFSGVFFIRVVKYKGGARKILYKSQELYLPIALFLSWLVLLYKYPLTHSYLTAVNWRNISPIHIFSIGYLLYSYRYSFRNNIKTQLIIFLLSLLSAAYSFSLYKSDRIRENIQISDAAELNDYIDRSIKDGYQNYIWTGSGNHSYSKDNFWFWANYRYANNRFSEEIQLKIDPKSQFFNLRGERDYKVSKIFKQGLEGDGSINEQNFRQKLKNYFSSIGLLQIMPPNVSHELNDKRLNSRLIIRMPEIEHEVGNLRNLLALLKIRYGFLFKTHELLLGSQKFIIIDQID